MYGRSFISVVLIYIFFPATVLHARDAPKVDILIIGGKVLDGTGNPWQYRDIGITADRISFVGNARNHNITADRTIDASGMLVTPGFIDMHSHADPNDPEARKMLPQLYQGITTVVIGVDGYAKNSVAEDFARYEEQGIGTNVITYVGFNSARVSAMGLSDAPANNEQLAAMKLYVEEGMRGGAFGMSSGLFYVPGAYAATEEVIQVAAVSGKYAGIYDTHDRDLGAAYKGVGFLTSIAEGIEIGEKSGNRVIFSHFSPQGKHNYGRASEAAKLIEEARARGVNVMAAQHPYTATQSALTAYLLPNWAAADGRDATLERYSNPQQRERMASGSAEMLKIRGGAEKLLFADPNPDLNGRTLQEVAAAWDVSPFEATIRIVRTQGDAGVMNLDLYDKDNIRYLALQEWMMTCTDGGSSPAGQGQVHPRAFGAFPKKIVDYVKNEEILSVQFAIRGMTSLAASFLGLKDRGMLLEGFYADINVINLSEFKDKATYDNPQRYAEGISHVILNGEVVLDENTVTGVLAGRPIRRPGTSIAQNEQKSLN